MLQVLADVVVEAGQRALLGKVCMDQHCPDFYRDGDAASSIQGAREVAQYIRVRGSSSSGGAVVQRHSSTA